MMQAVLPRNFRFRMVSGFSRVVWKRPGEIYYIGGADVLPAPLTPQEESEIIQNLMNEEDEQISKEARTRLIEHNLRLVVYIAQ